MNKQQAAVTTDKSAIIASQIASGEATEASDDNTIDTRFGKVKINRDNPIVFSKGLLGMPDKTQFCLVDFPVEKFAQFKLLQSLDDNALSFITLPIDIDNPIIDRGDIESGCTELGFEVDDTAILLIVSVHRELKHVKLSANARAPLFMNAPKRLAEQYVLHNNKYVVRHMITG